MKRALLILLVACGSKHEPPPPTPGPAHQMVEDTYYVEPGAPDPLACATAADCMIDQVTDDTGCCRPSGFPYPQSKAWNQWMTQHRGNCNMACPGMMSPPVPKDCLVQLQCVNHRCANSC